MQPIEQAIRNALAKGDMTDQAFRKRVYASALSAMERSAAERGLGEAQIAARRTQVSSVIIEVERAVSLEIKAAAVQPSVPTGFDIDSVRNADSGLSSLDQAVKRPNVVRPDGRPERRAAELERIESLANTPEAVQPPPVEPPKRPRNVVAEPAAKRAPYAALLVTILTIVALGMLAWWVLTTELFATPDPDSGPVPNPRTDVEETYDPAPPARLGEANEQDQRDWVNIFTASDPAGLSVPAGASAELETLNGIVGVRISASAQATEIGFPVGSGILETFAGKTVIFDVIARSAEQGRTVPLAVRCVFGADGTCSRKRYDVHFEYGDLLFRADIPQGAQGDGMIYIQPEAGADNSAIIERIRVTESTE